MTPTGLDGEATPVPLYMDRHDSVPDQDQVLTKEEVVEAHQRDLDVQGKYGVRYLTALIDMERQLAFCIVNAPSKEAAEAVHREAHGAVANQILEVSEPVLEQFIGALKGLDTGELHFESALRIILFTDIEGSTPLIGRLGDEAAARLQSEHDQVIRSAVCDHGGRLVKHTGDGAMACFSSVVSAVESAIEIQQVFDRRSREEDWPIRVRVGLSAGEPVTMAEDLFGLAVNLAARICEACPPGHILAPYGVRELALGKGFRWEDRGLAELRGFDEPVHLFALDWTASVSPLA